ncbi:putative gustatory receptor 59b [Drosophila grimshawi]|uniref:Gustatory receptor n=1 Tax=Drosophila grimshawi TaxID=7222 RepID=B4JW48_DROGR|nr:putative gustatory receptor 59b [Drosophila grimshawi]EDV98186.1 GH22814 [Drosophila grimshawi]
MVAPHWILWLYENYALVLGVTSNRRIYGGRLRQTCLTRSYALILNIVVLLTVPYFMWTTMEYMNTVRWFPNRIPYATHIFYSVCYVAIAYTLISRNSRDKALLEVDILVRRLKRLKPREGIVSAERINGSLSYLFYIKLITVTYMCMCNISSCLMMLTDSNLDIVYCTFFVNISLTIPLVAIYRYFLALWDIACCYQYIKGKLEHLMNCVRNRYPTQVELEELHRLWSLHALLGRSTLKFNRTYGLLMLTARFENLAFSVLNCYWGILLIVTAEAPIVVLFYGSTHYFIRLLDFFLLNFMCDLTTQYQNCAYHSVSEGYWFKELNAYLLYASTSKLNLWVCGLYKVNRKCWYQLLLSILNLTILLLQFHLVLKKKFIL